MNVTALVRISCSLVLACAVTLTAHAAASKETPLPSKASGFVRVNSTQFEIDGKPYFYLGANFWSAMNLAAPAPTGDRARLERELDRLKAHGITNLRVLAGSEGPDSEPLRIVPALQIAPGLYNQALLEGLDYLLEALSRRQMKAVMVLNNYWHWSGGFGQYLVWASESDHIPYPPPVGIDWYPYQIFVARFYGQTQAQQLYRNHIRAIVTRKSTLTGRLFRDDPTIMSWELANEPRAMDHPYTYAQWIDETSTFVRSLDPNHLITVGTEGDTCHPKYSNSDYYVDHHFTNIDYGTVHVEPQNYGWYNPEDPHGLEVAVERTLDYLKMHVRKSCILGKPLVLQEFGLARDQGSFEPTATVSSRDLYFRAVLDTMTRWAAQGLPMVGANFWTWSGEVRPVQPGSLWKAGDPFTGDPPHEKQGWYGIYSTDTSTLKLLETYATRLSSLQAAPAPMACFDEAELAPSIPTAP